jgi:hypothetical protein
MNLSAFATTLSIILATTAAAQVSDDTIRSISTPDRVDTRIGTLTFDDGAPGADTVNAVYDNLDQIYAIRAFSQSITDEE